MAAQHEVIVILSGATDTTDAVQVAGLPMRTVAEPRRGLSVARNRGLDLAQGDILIWLDDDAEVVPGLLAAYAEGAMAMPQAGYFAGKITAAFEAPPPRWIDRLIKIAPYIFAQKDLGPEPFIWSEARPFLPFGANMALRRSALGDLRFSENLGRGAEIGAGWEGHLVGGEETHLVARMRSRGIHGKWLPHAHVRHWIALERMTLSHVRRYFRGQGAEAALVGRPFHGNPTPYRRLVQSISYALARLFGMQDRWLRLLIQREKAKGYRAGQRWLKRGS
jgi:glycosyltransferase involved in cell wall biosynthesis